MSQFRLPVTVVPGCMICGKDLGAEYTVKCTGNSVEWYCPEHAENPSDAMARLMESVNNLHQTLHVLYGDNGPQPTMDELVRGLESTPAQTREYRTLEDGYGGQVTDTRTGITTSVGKPGTRQQRWVTPWEDVPPITVDSMFATQPEYAEYARIQREITEEIGHNLFKDVDQ